MKARLFAILLILIVDFVIYQTIKSEMILYANHDGAYNVLVMQGFAIIEIALNLKISKFVMESLGVYKNHREYYLVTILVCISWLELYSAIIGANKWGNPCWRLEVCEPSDFK